MFRKLLLAVAISTMVLVLIDCKNDNAPEPSLKDKQLQMLIGTWNDVQVVKDGIAQPGFENFKVTISGTPGSDTFNYTCVGRPNMSPWPSSGTFTFGVEPITDLVRDQSTQYMVNLSYTVKDSDLHFEFDYLGGFPARMNDVPGHWTFDLAKN